MDETCFMTANLSCFFLASVYVGSLYIWKSNEDRNHPKTVIRRFISAFCMLFVAPVIVYVTLKYMKPQESIDLLTLLGLRWNGLLLAIFVPVILTSVLFLGPITSSFFDGSWKDLFSAECWKNNLHDILWIRNQIVAPISEEFTFRACMLPQLLKCYSNSQAVLVSPLFFGVGHFHHMVERWRQGMPLAQSLLLSCFQFAYTTLFGMYAAFLFIRTGNVAAPCVAHAFCNVMGFPDFGEIGRLNGWKRIVLASAFVVGLLGWYFLLWPLTEPTLYDNNP
ncbi:CAAX prenyl protease 2-like [Daphnia pulicaria]|uniref:CAAX prenyl protease 2-like n=1 Tax=Daphnia pulicaria TaxID=35523 RepID=UPI001EEC7493|nr:CAAX prenyl protease 2-like [Daphnia pulicaria]